MRIIHPRRFCKRAAPPDETIVNGKVRKSSRKLDQGRTTPAARKADRPRPPRDASALKRAITTAYSLTGMSRMQLYRARLMADLPEELFERLITGLGHETSAKELANVALALQGKIKFQTEHCPHCGGHLRTRSPFQGDTLQIVRVWLREQREAA